MELDSVPRGNWEVVNEIFNYSIQVENGAALLFLALRRQHRESRTIAARLATVRRIRDRKGKDVSKFATIPCSLWSSSFDIEMKRAEIFS